MGLLGGLSLRKKTRNREAGGRIVVIQDEGGRRSRKWSAEIKGSPWATRAPWQRERSNVPARARGRTRGHTQALSSSSHAELLQCCGDSNHGYGADHSPPVTINTAGVDTLSHMTTCRSGKEVGADCSLCTLLIFRNHLKKKNNYGYRARRDEA